MTNLCKFVKQGKRLEGIIRREQYQVQKGSVQYNLEAILTLQHFQKHLKRVDLIESRLRYDQFTITKIQSKQDITQNQDQQKRRQISLNEYFLKEKIQIIKMDSTNYNNINMQNNYKIKLLQLLNKFKYTTNFCIYLLYYSTELHISLVEGYQLVSNFQFGNTNDCYDNHNKDEWKLKGTNDTPSCYNQCKEKDNQQNRPAFIFSSNIQGNIIYTTTINGSEQFSIVGVDIIYFSSENNLAININTNKYSFSLDNTKLTVFEQTQPIMCPTETHFSQASLQFKSTSKQISIEFDKNIQPYQSPRLGIRSMKIWTNCVNNCEQCKSIDSCQICRGGFQIYQIDGKGLCEQSNDCSLFIQKCQKCIVDQTPDCIECQPGYKLNSNTCLDENIENISCQSNEYFDSFQKKCLKYSSTCYLQDKGMNTFSECRVVKNLDLQSYKCPSNQMIIIYDYQNYSISKCGCLIENCKNCLNMTQCINCNAGFIFDFSQQRCIPDCQQNQYYDNLTNSCIDCQGCQRCNSEQCIECLTDEYHINQSKPQNCILCQVPNCEKCFQTNQCYTCKQGYDKDEATQTCKIQCNVLNCQECMQNQTNKCKICLPGYQVSQNQYQCIDQCSLIKNCQDCNINDRTKCNTCNNGFYFTETNQCNDRCSLIQNCLECPLNDKTICKICKQGFILSQDSKTCVDKCTLIDNCEKCLEPDRSICVTCLNGFELSDDSKSCVDPCSQIKYCIQCNTKNKKHCSQCSKGYYLNKTTLLCEKCQVDNCQICNIFSTSCKICQQGYYKLSNDTCSLIALDTEEEITHINLQQQLQEDGYVIKVKCDKMLHYLPVQTENLITIKITNINNYSYRLTDLSKGELTLQVQVNENVKEQVLTLEIQDEIFLQVNRIQEQKLDIPLSPYVKISIEQKEQIKEMKAVGQGIANSMLSGFIPVIIFGNFYILINMIDMTGFLYYLLYVNIRLPKNVTDFYEIFKNFQFPFIPNLFEAILPKNYVQTSPKKFMEMESDCYFIKNAGQSMTITSFVITLYIIVKILSKYKIKYLQPYLQKVLQNTWEFGAFFDMLGTVYIYALVGVLLQFYVFDFGDDKTYLLNYILFGIYTILCFSIPFILVYVLYKQKNLKDDSSMQKKLSTLVGGLKLFNSEQLDSEKQQQGNILSDNNLISTKNKVAKNMETTQIIDKCTNNFQSINNFGFSNSSFYIGRKNNKTRREIHIQKYSKYLNGILYIRKLIFCSLIVFMHNYTILQLCLISSLNIYCSFFYFYIIPHERYSENIKNGICEIILLVIQITVSFLIKDDKQQDESDRIKIGWIIVSLSSVIILWNFFVMVFDMLKELITFVRSKIVRKNKDIKIQSEKVFSTQNLSKINSEKNFISIKVIKESQDQQFYLPSDRFDQQICKENNFYQNNSQQIGNISKQRMNNNYYEPSIHQSINRKRTKFNKIKVSQADNNSFKQDMTCDIESNIPTNRPSLVEPEIDEKKFIQPIQMKARKRKSKYQQSLNKLTKEIHVIQAD